MEKKPAGFLRLGYCGRGCPSPSALRHCRRWSFTRWHPLDFLPAWFLSARAHAIRLFRRLFLNDLEKAFDSGRLRFCGSLEKFSCGTLTSFVATSLRCTKPNGSSMPNRFCGTSTSARLRGPLRASRGDFQQSSTGHRTRPGRVSMEGLPSQRQTKEDDLAVAIPLVAFIVALYECGPLVI